MISDVPIQLIVGLSNPGKPYEKTRHNVGSWLIHSLLKKEHLSTLKLSTQFYAWIGSWRLSLTKYYLLIPTTYMNHSGRSVSAVSNFYHIPSETILIVHDDLDLPPGVAQFKWSGGEGGHKGLKNIVQYLGTKDFWRLRIGIGHPGQRSQVHHYVLDAPSEEDRQKIEFSIEKALNTLPTFIQGNPQKAMNSLHSKK